MLGLTVPERAVWLRTLLAEHTRILSHLGFLTFAEHRAGVDVGTARVREELRASTYRLTGNRIHPMANRIGGLAVDADAGWVTAERAAADRADEVAARLVELVDEDPVAGLTRGTAPLGRAVVEQYGVSGPAARGAGIDLDLRRQQPYLAYAALAVPPTRRTTGDAHARLAQLVDEVRASTELIRQCADRLTAVAGPVSVKLGKIVRLPEGESYVAVEAPLGIAGVFVVSRGEKTPWRLKLRTPSFSNVSALEAVLVGVRTDAIEATLASIGYVVGDIDR
jgi:NADH-quinone oxidoreductase subunit D